jgi:hypothetical protein
MAVTASPNGPGSESPSIPKMVPIRIFMRSGMLTSDGGRPARLLADDR